MTEIICKDELRAKVEAESGGKQTILYTSKGLPSYMNVIPKFRCEDILPSLGTGVHPAFIVNGIEKSEILIGTYQAVIRDGIAVSLPGQAPATRLDFDAARAACIAAGPDFHLMTNWEWAAIALWCIANGHNVRGNTNYGQSHSHPEERGQLADNGSAVLTGTGPDSWRHDGTPYGIADLVGNVWEWNDGLKLAGGRIIMPPDNNYALPESEWPDTGVCIDMPGSSPMISDSVTERDWDGGSFCDVAVKEGFVMPAMLKQALLYPADGLKLPGCYWVDNSEDFEALPLRGGRWSGDSDAGLAALRLSCERSRVISGIGFRPAFIG